MLKRTIFLFILIISQSILLTQESSSFDVKETFDTSNQILDTDFKQFDNYLTSKELISQMGLGYNLANIFDLTEKDINKISSYIEPTESLIETISKKGFKTIRIPITWRHHLIDENYTIDPKFITKIKTIVDWCIKKNLYVIINSQYDNDLNKGYYLLKNNVFTSENFLYNIWKQISLAFNNGYNEHLIFECLNEPSYGEIKTISIINESKIILKDYLSLIIETIRSTKGNNSKRFIIITPLLSSYQNAMLSNFLNFNDKNIILGLQMFSPIDFADNNYFNFNKFEENFKIEIYSNLKALYEKYVERGMQIIITQFGAVNKNNSEERIKWGKFYIENAKKYNIGLILWDNGIFDNTNSPENVFGFLNKKNLNWENEEIINEYILTENKKINNTINQYEIISNDSLITMPYEFRDWYGYFDLGIGILSTFNSYNKLILEQGEISYVTEYKSLRLMINDEYLLLTQDEVIGAEVYEKYGTIIIGFNDNLIELNFTIDHLKKIKENGVHLVGHGFSLKKIIVYGPRLINADSMILKADNKNQIIKLNFNEDARAFIGNMFLEDEDGNFIEGMKCNLDENEYNIIVCNGSFNKIGYYKIVDNNGVTLTNKYLEVVQ